MQGILNNNNSLQMNPGRRIKSKPGVKPTISLGDTESKTKRKLIVINKRAEAFSQLKKTI